MIRFDDLPSGSNPVAPLSFDDLPGAAKPATGLSAIADAAKLMGKATLAPFTTPLEATNFLAEDPENGRALLASNIAGLVAQWKGTRQRMDEATARGLRDEGPVTAGYRMRLGLDHTGAEAETKARGFDASAVEAAAGHREAAGARNEARAQLGLDQRPTSLGELPGYWGVTAAADFSPTLVGLAAARLGGPVVGGVVMGAGVSGDTFATDRAAGVPYEQAARHADVTGLIEAGSEALGLSAITGRLAKLLGDAKLADTFVGRLATKLEATTGGRLVEGTVGEGFTEALSSAAQDIYEAGEFDRQIDWPQFRNNIIDAFMVGGITGGPLAGGVEMARPKQPAPPIQQRENLLTGGTVATPVIAPKQQAVQPEAAYAPALQSFAAGPAPSEEVALDQLDERLVAQVPEPAELPEPTPEMVEAQKEQAKKSEARRERIDAIQPFVGKISDEQRRVEADAIAQVKADPDAAVAAYRALPKTKGGRIVNTDEARELFSSYNSGPEGRSAHAVSVHEASSAIAKEVLQENLEAPSTSNDPTVFFTGGGTGAGKSTAVERHDETAALQDKADFIYDGNLHETKKAEKLFERARKSGRRSEVTYTIRDPLQAWTHGALPRANREDYGRTVPISIQAETHIGAAKTALELIEKYGLKSGGDVSLRLLYNSFAGKDNPANEVREGTVEDLQRIAAMDQKQLEDELYDALEVEFAEGRISERVYNGTRESSPEVVARGDSRKGRAQLSGPDAGNEGRAGAVKGPGPRAADSRGEGAPPSAGQPAPEGAGQAAPARVTEERPARKPDEVDALARKAESAGAPVVVVDDISELPEQTRRELNDQGDVRAAYANGTIYIIRNRVTDTRTLKRDLAHEVAHHVAGEWAMANALKIIDAARNATSNPRTAAALRDVLASYDAGSLGAEGVADEIVAHMAEEYAGLTGRMRLLANELIAAIRKALRGFAADMPLGDREILAQLSKRLRAAQKAAPRPARALRGLEQESLKINTRGGESIQIVRKGDGWSARWESGGESPVRPTPQDVMADVEREVEASGDAIAMTSERREPTRERTRVMGKRTGIVGEEVRIGTRNPGAVKSTEKGTDAGTQIGLEAMRRDAKQFAKNMKVVAGYIGFKPTEGATTEEIAAQFVQHAKQNLLLLYNAFTPKLRARARQWYDGARKLAEKWSKDYGYPVEAIGGVIASLSPQKDWFMNVSLAQRVIDVVKNKRDFRYDARMEELVPKVAPFAQHQKVVDAIRGKTYAELTDLDQKAMFVRLYDEAHASRNYTLYTPEGNEDGLVRTGKGDPAKPAWGDFRTIGKAISILEDSSAQNISEQLGEQHKVRSFYNNIVSPKSKQGDVTIDTHAVAAALLRPLSGTATEVLHNFGGTGIASSNIHGTVGTYGIYAEAYRLAAAEVGILPREMQSITWEAVRALYSPAFKRNAAKVERVNQLWTDYTDGKIGREEVLAAVLEITNGIATPEWAAGRGTPDAGAGGDAADARELPADGTPRGRARSVPGGAGSGAAGSNPLDGRTRAKRTGGDAVRQLRRADDGAVSGYFARGSAGNAGHPRVLGHSPLARFTPDERVVAALAEVGIAAQEIAELPETANSSYHGAISAAKAASAFGSSVYVYPVEDYAAMRLFVVGNGSAGFALKGDDIVSVFSDGSSKGVAHSMLLLATQEGGRRLDAFNTVLPKIYAAHGFRTAAKLPWNDEFAPEDWSKETYAKFNAGEPDVVFMAHDPAFMGAPDVDAVDYAADYDAAVAAQQALLGRPARAKRTGARVEPPTRPTNVREPLEFLYERASRYGTESPALPSVLMDGLDEIEWGFTGMPARRAIEGGLASLPQDVKVGFNRAMRAIEDESARTARDARPRAKRYVPTGPRPDDLIALDGKRHWGEIDAAFLSEVKSNAKIVKGGLITLSVNGRPQKMSVPAPGKIVVKVGAHGPDPANPSKTKGFGLAHIDGSHGAELRAAGYEVEPFVEEVINGFDEVWLQPDGRLVLMKNKAGSKPMVMIVELRKEQGVWNVVGAFIASGDWRQRQTGKGHRLIWDGRNSPSRKAAQSQGVRNFPSTGSGSPGTPSAPEAQLPQRDQVAPTPSNRGLPVGAAAATPNPAVAGLGNMPSTSETGPAASVPQVRAKRQLTREEYVAAAEAAGYDTSKTYYHGTSAKSDFDTFKVGKGGVNELGSAIYITDQTLYAGAWARGEHGRLIPLWLKRGDLYDLRKHRDGVSPRGVLPTPGEFENIWEPLAQRIRNDPSRLSELQRTWLDEPLRDHATRLRDSVRAGVDINEWLKIAGYVGAVDSASQIPGQVAVFESSSLKSTISNSGEFNPNKSSIRAKRNAPNFSDATLPSTNFMRQLREHNSSLVPRLWEAAKAGGRKLRLLMQDRFLPVAWVQDLIIESGGTIDDSGNTYQRESVYYGRVGNMIRLLKKDMIEPLFKRMAELNVPVEDLELYLYARFAPDRNAKIASINPKIPEGGSGMTDEDAAQVMADFASAGMTNKLAELAKLIDKMNAARIDLLERYGLLSSEEATEWRAEPNYVPLKGIAEGTQDEEAPTRLSTGKGFSVGGREAFRAMGRKSRATDILANTIAQVQQAIVRSERNRIMQSFLSLVLGNPNPDLWEIARIKMKPVRDVATGEYAINQDFNTAFVAERETHSSPDIVTVKVKGKQYAIRVKDQRLADAIKNAGTAQLGPVLATLASVGRALSLTRTTLAPEFMVANFARDIQTAIVNLSAEDSLAMARAVVRDIGPAMRGVYRTEREKSRKTDWQQYYEEFLQAGGKTDFVAPKSVEELAKELRSMAQKAKSPSSIGPQFKRFTLDWIMAANASIENAVRLSAYVNSRRRGLSEQQAASVAKNLTVNFNRKGQLGPAFNALYMFFNASVQGSARFIQVMANPQTRRFALGFAASTATLGYVLAEVARAMAGDDDDGESLWEKMPDWEKSRNVILFLPEALVGPSEELQASLQDGSAPDWMKSMVGILPGGGAYLKLPMPYVYNVFYLMGQAASDVRHGKSAYQGAGMIAHALATSFNPFGDADSGSLAKFVAPTVLDPVIDVEQNRNFFGAPIRPVDNPFDKVKEPDSAKYFESTNPIAIWVAKALNEATGGTELRKGAIDVSPTTMEYAFNFVTGGTGAFIDRAVTFVSKVASGEDVPISKVPFLRVVYGEPSERRASDTYYRVREDAAMRIEEVDLLRETSQGRQLSEEERGAAAVAGKLKPALNASERAMRGLRKQRKIVKASETMTAAEKDAKVKQIDEAILAAQLAFNTVYFGAVE